MNETHEDLPEGIAIIGMACRVPGANTPEQFWQNISNGVESVTWFTDEQLRTAGVDPALLQNPEYVKAGIRLDQIDCFDAGLFGMTRREAEILDPQQRILMECAYAALEDAGYDPAGYPGLIGIYAGVGGNAYVQQVLAQPDLREAIGGYQIALSNEKDFLATRIAYKLDLKGPSLTVQTSCSTSLVATHLACQSLLNFESDMMLVGGCSIDLDQDRGYLYQEGGILSPDGRGRPFDAQARGTMGGRGAGIVVLKRLADAVAAGDTIYAVIKGSAINNDGSLKVGFTAPSQDGQAAVIAAAQMLAGVEPESITYIETHGTGTSLGDPIEFAALSQVFGAKTARRNFCALGAVKPNIGHLDTAAGVVGLMKAALALKHRQIPPLINFSHPNPKIDLENSPFYIATELTEWLSDGMPRRAGVSAFGIGGTNAHVILEEAPSPSKGSQPAAESAAQAHLLVFSAKTRTALDAATAQLSAHMGQTEQPLADIAATLQLGRKAYAERRVLVAHNRGEAAADLLALDPKNVFTATADQGQPPLVWMFPGQGAQSVGMAGHIYTHEPVFRQAVDECAELLRPHLGLDLRGVLYPAAEAEIAAAQLGQTALTQPAIFVVEYALAQLWLSWGLKPAAMVGHSIGEYVAACLAGVFALPDALFLVAARGRLMQALPAGAMLAVPLAEDEVTPHLGSIVAIAAINGPHLCTITGPIEAVDDLRQRLDVLGVECRPLQTSHAFHSPMMDPILDEWTRLVAGVQLSPPQQPYISNLTGDWITAEQATSPDYWARHLRENVRWNDGLATLFQDPRRFYLELGPGQTLTTLVKRHPDAPDKCRVTSSLARPGAAQNDLCSLLTALGQLWLAGAAITWSNLAATQGHGRVALPTYPFARGRYWIDPPPSANNAPPSANHPALKRETTMSEAPAKAAVSARHDRLIAELGTLMYRLTGSTLEEIGAESDFFEVGLDSLLLIQFNQAIQDSFGVKISLIQLLEQYTTLSSIATFLDQQLPADQFTAVPQPAQPAAPFTPPSYVQATPPPSYAQPAPSAPSSYAAPAIPAPIQPAPSYAQPTSAQLTPAGAGAMEQVMTQQLQAMTDIVSRQIDALRTGGGPTSVMIEHPASATPANPAPAPTYAAPLQAAPQDPTAPALPGRKVEPTPYMPYRPAEVAQNTDLTPRQQAYLQEFIERYNRRTQRSKQLTQHYRPVFSDSRNTAIFRLVWKELIYPIVGHRSAGSKVWDVDANEYVDVTMGFGVHLFGHSPRFIMDALADQMAIGMHLGPQSYLAGEVSKLICELTGVERVNFCNSGTEAVMGAIRIARTVRRKTKIVCFAGAYHGWADGTMARQLTVGGKLTVTPMAPGIPPLAIEDVMVLNYDDPQSLETIRAHAHELAAVLVEPVQSRQPDLQPHEFLHALRALTAETGVPLIFDEMVNGFRIAPGGAQAFFDIKADIVTYGKIVGGGLPIGIIAGKAEYMDTFDGGMWQYGDDSYPEAEKTLFAGAFFKNPLTMAAALATLSHIKMQGQALYDQLNQRTTNMAARLNAYFEQQQVPMHVVHFSSVFRFYIPREARYLDLFFYHLTEKGIYNWEGGNCFLSTAHTDEDIERIIQAVQDSIADLRRGGFLPEGPDGSDDGRASRRSSDNSNGNGIPAAAGTSAGGGGQILPTAPASNWQSSMEIPTTTAAQVALHGPTGMQFSLYYFGSYAAEYAPEKYDLLFNAARYADDNGFSAIWIPERHFHSFGSISPNPVVAAAALSRVTSRIHIRAGSVALPLHHPLRVAEEWSIVDNLSHGRVGISFASGWHPDDFVFAPGAYENRRQVMLDSINVVRHLWRGDSLKVRGGAQSHRDLTLFPLPSQPELPSWLTCSHISTFVKAGEMGFGVLTNLLDQSIADLTEKIQAYRAALSQHGHDPDAGHVTLLMHTFLSDTIDTAVETAREPFFGYLRSSLGLVRNMVKGQGREVDLERLSEDDLRYILSDTYNRIVRAGTLIGTPESCQSLVEELWQCGVDEIGCLIDFGVDPSLVMDSMPHVDALRRMFAQHQRHARLNAAPDDLGPSAILLPLTEAQKGLWVLAQLGDEEARLYNESLALRLSGPLEMEAIRLALQTIVDRHDSLRITFTPEGDYQMVAPILTLDIPLVDLADSSPNDHDRTVAEIIAAEGRQVFDLVRGPLLRVKLLRLSDEAHVLLLTIHHIITDGWSIDIVMRELNALYAAAIQGQAAELPEPLQFSDYVAWVQRQEEAGAEQHWLGQFAGQVPVLELPIDHPRPAIRRFNGTQSTAVIDAELIQEIQGLASRHGATLFMTLLAGFNLLMHRLSGQNDVVVGAPAAGQLAMGGKYLTGYCLNLLALRSTIDPTQSFSSYLTQVRRTLLAAYEYQGFPFGTLIKKLKLDQDMSRAPLVSVVFNLEKGGGGSGEGGASLGNLQAEMVSDFGGLARFDININMVEAGGSLTLFCDYNTDLFEPATISRWLGYFEQLLRQICAQPERELWAYRMLPAAEYQELMVTRNATAVDYNRDACFHQLFEAQVDRTPDAIAAICGQQRLNYRDLDQRANQLAHYLRLQGIGPGARVGVCFERSLEMLIGLIGIFKAGGAFVPLDPTFPAERMSYILDDAEVALVLTQAPLRERLPKRERSPICLDTDWPLIEHAPLERPASAVSAQHLCYLIYTSGSTGRPKGVLIPHQGLMNYLIWCVEAYGAASGTGAPVHASIAADAIFPSLFAPLLAGTSVVFFPGEAALDRLAEAVQHEGPWSLIKITPSQLEVMTQSLPETDASTWVGTLVIGAEEVRGEVLRYWQRNAPATVLLNEYGPTETVVGCSIYHVPEGRVIQGTVPIGLPIANIQFYVLDAHGQPVPVGVPGELYIGGDGVAWGYHNQQALTAEKFVPDPFNLQPGARLYRTGDLVRWIDDRAGNVEFLGRIDDQVKIRGYRVEPGEVAGVLAMHPAIREAVVQARSDAPGTKRLVAYLVVQDVEPTLAELRQFLHERLPEYMVPSAFVFLPAIPLAPHGKINRSALPAPEEARPALETDFVAPATPAEQQLAALWTMALGIEQVGIHDDFFKLGGDSLLAVRLIARVRDTFQVDLPPRTIFEKPTIDSLVLAITEQLGAAADEELLAQLLDDLDDMPYELPLQAN